MGLFLLNERKKKKCDKSWFFVLFSFFSFFFSLFLFSFFLFLFFPHFLFLFLSFSARFSGWHAESPSPFSLFLSCFLFPLFSFVLSLPSQISLSRLPSLFFFPPLLFPLCFPFLLFLFLSFAYRVPLLPLSFGFALPAFVHFTLHRFLLDNCLPLASARLRLAFLL
jgi:hypothetical protein